MASRPHPTSRRNRTFGPSPAACVDTVVTVSSGLDPVVSSGLDPVVSSGPDTPNIRRCNSVSDEVKELKRFGILPRDFPSRDGDVEGAQSQDDVAKELDELLKIGAISAENVRARQTSDTNETVAGEQEIPDYVGNRHEIPDFDEDGLPINWDKMSSFDEVFTLVELHRGDDEFNIIEKEFTDVHIKVKSIERLQNRRLLARFKGEAEEIQRDRTEDFSLNVNYLYHGSNVKKETLCEEGLDQRLSRMGYFGRGIYFSDNPLKCVHYSEDFKQEGPYEAYILKCRVILGDTKVYPKGSNDIDLQREPEKETKSHGSKFYDSVLGCPKDFNEFVVYENRRAMIEYIITFQADDSVIRNLRQIAKGTPAVKSSLANKHQGTKSRATGASPTHTEIALPEPQEDHFSRISDVREAVRRKRLGQTYSAPSQEQQTKDRAMWGMIQKLQGVKCEDEKNTEDNDDELTGQSPYDDSTLMSELDLLEVQPSSTRELTSHSSQSRNVYESRSRLSPVIMWDTEPETREDLDWLTATSVQHDQDNIDIRDDNPVGQVLSVCVAEFLSVTGLEDSSLAKHYVQKAEMDVNHAISMFYEDSG